MRVIDGIPLGCPLLLTVTTVNYATTLKDIQEHGARFRTEVVLEETF
jgi:hypothetical protein